MSRIYDCFTFKNELLLLELRLYELSKYVDRFILVEGTRSFTNRPKPLFFLEHKKKFEPFLDKITHIIVDDFPSYTGDTWQYQMYQRNAIVRGLAEAQPEDLIMVSDVDEVPRPSSIAAFLEPISIVENRHYFYKFNLRAHWGGNPFLSTHMTRMRWFRGAESLRGRKKLYPFWRIDKRPFWDPLYRHNPHIIKDGGWHFSFLMSPEDILDKIKDYSSKRYRCPGIDRDSICQAIQNSEDLRGVHAGKMIAEPIDESFPFYIRSRQQQLAPWIAENTG